MPEQEVRVHLSRGVSKKLTLLAKCEWDGSVVCLRCRTRGNTCPLAPRKLKKPSRRSIKSVTSKTSPEPTTSPESSNTVDVDGLCSIFDQALSHNTRAFLAAQGKERLRALGLIPKSASAWTRSDDSILSKVGPFAFASLGLFLA